MKRHNSQRGYFAYYLYQEMKKNKDIWLIVGDLGYKVFDQHFKDFPERCLNTGAAEQAMMDISVGLALSGKIPFVYSITPFLLGRPFETIRTYINYERIPVKMVGSGRDKDYKQDGISHWSEDDRKIMSNFKNIISLWPENKQQIEKIVNDMVSNSKPYYLNLRR